MRIPALNSFVGVLIFFLLFCGLASATEYYVSTSGNDSNNGTLNYPWLSPSKISGLAQFDTLNIAEGSYSGGLAIPQDNITVIGTGSVWLNGTGTEKALEINYKDNFILENVNFFNYDSGVQELGCNNTLKNCTFGNFTGINTGAALTVDGHLYPQARSKALTNVTFYNCDFYNCDSTLSSSAVPNMINIDGADPSLSEPTMRNIKFINTEIYGTASHQIFNIKSRNVGINSYTYNGLEDLYIDGVYIHDIVSYGTTTPNAIYTIYGGAENVTFKNAVVSGLKRYAVVGNYINSTFENISVSGTVQDYPAVFLDDAGFTKYPTGTKIINVSATGTTNQNRIVFDSPLGLINYANLSNVQYYESKANMTITSPANSAYYIQAKGNGSVTLNYPTGMVISATLTSANAPYVFSSPSYTPTGTLCSLTQQTGGTTSSTVSIIAYNYSAKPATGTATVTPRTPVGSEECNFTANSTNGNQVNFTAWNLTPGTSYSIKKDGSVIATQTANSSGYIGWNNSVWSEHTFTVESVSVNALIDNYPESNYGATRIVNADDSGVGQTFISDSNYNLTTVSFYVGWSVSDTHDTQAYLFNVSGSPTVPNSVNLSDALASSNVINATGSPENLTLTNYTFNYPLIAGQEYAVVLTLKNRSRTVTGDNLLVGWDNTTPTHAGHAVYRANGGTTAWTGSTGYDTIFYAYGELVSQANITITTSKTDPTTTVNSNEIFTAASNHAGVWTWYLNGELVQTNTSSNVANYTASRAEEGIYNITAFVTDGSTTDRHMWNWTVVDHFSYYVSNTGNNSNNGMSIGAAWANVSYAVRHTQPGAVIYVLPGTYNEVRPMCNVSGTTSAPITITKYNGTVLMQGSNTSLGDGYNWAFDLNNSNYWIIDNISFSTYYMGVQARSTRGVVIRNCNFSYTNHSAVAMTGTYDALIENSSFYRCDWNSIGMGNTSTPPYEGCTNITIKNNNISHAMTHSSIDMAGNFSGIYIHNNSISNTPGNAVYTHQTVLSGWLNSGYVVVSNNRFSNCSAIPIYFDDPTNNSVISSNTFSEINLPSGGYSWIKTSDLCSNLTLSDNILVGSDANYLMNLNIANSTLYNNTVSNTGAGVDYYFGSASSNNTVYDHRFINNNTYKINAVNGTVINKFNNGRVFTTGNNNISYTPSGSIYIQSIGVIQYRLYDYSAKPVTGTATVIPNTLKASEIVNFTANTTNGNQVNFTAWNLTAGKSYIVKKDGSQHAIVTANASGYISFNNSVWSEHTFTIEEAGLIYPVANFTTNVTSGARPLTVQFNDTSSNATSWAWDFGDNTTSISRNVTHTYSGVGNYTVNLTASNANGTDSKLGYINVTKATPTITWNNPANITYGTALSGTQNNATASVPGTFVYSPASGTVLAAGSRTLNVTFTPTDSTNYTNATKSVTLIVNKANSSITWNNPANITYGTALSGTQNNATANVSGTFVYNPVNGTVLGAGTRTLNVTFTPTDSTNYSSSTASVTLNIVKATPVITWNNPANITNGTALSGTQLNANANIAGSFVYNPSSGTILAAGNNQVLNCTFTPTDSSNYTTATTSVYINVISKIIPTITWSNPANITYGTALSNTQLNANASIAGSYVYNKTVGTILPAGTNVLGVTFTPTDSTNYTNATKSVMINVTKATPTITWNNPANITYGAALGSTQLNANASVPGTFIYSPASGVVLNVGNRTLNTTFTPTDSTNYTTATKSVYINIIPQVPVAAFSANVTNGYKPLVVAFTDTSSNSPTSWSWDLNGDGNEDSTVQNPICAYPTAGTYTVSLTATNAGGSDTEIKSGYIIVRNPAVTVNDVINLTNASVRVNNLTFDEFVVEKKVILTNDTISCKQDNSWANLTLLPNKQINVTVNTWNVAGDYSRIWNESSSIANTVTSHRITGYPENTYIDIYRDGVGYTTVKSDADGMINWTYDGGYSEHTFETRISDTQITISSPSAVEFNSSVLSTAYDPSAMSTLYDSVTGTVSSGYTLAGLMVLALGAAGILRYLGYI